jgi:ATP-dependent DNA helicase RecG
MLSVAELEALMVELESDRTERKANLTDRDKIRQAICAFANDLPDHRQPGVIFVGINDDGSCAHLAVTDQLLLTLADMRSDGVILPFPMMTVEKVTLQGCTVAVVEVQPSYNPPVRVNGRAWIRVGPRRATASPEEERRLAEKRRAGDLPFDQQSAADAAIADLDLDLFQREYLPLAVAPEVLIENERSTEEQLLSLRFLTRQAVPTNAAVLLFSTEPRRWLPGAYVQFLRLDGADLTDPIRHQAELSGPLGQVLRQIDEVLEANISVASSVMSGPTEIRHPDYPIVALQQLARNAVLHRTYEGTSAPARIYWFADRIELYSPGGPYGQVNADNFGQPGTTDYRNPMVAEAMKVLGFVQRFGLGIPLARRELGRNGNPALEFQVAPTGVLVVVRRRP